jgi:hypothetical protein
MALSQHGGGEKVNNATLHDVRRERAPVDESLLSCRMLAFWRAQLVDADAIKWRWTHYAGSGAKTPSVSSLQVCAKDGSVSVSQSQSLAPELDIGCC